MIYFYLLVLLTSGLVANCLAVEDASLPSINFLPVDASSSRDCVVLPNPTNAVRFRLYTNASPDAAHLFNTFAVEAYGEKMLLSPTWEDVNKFRGTATTDSYLHNLLVDGLGAELNAANGISVVDQASGSDWCYMTLDATRAYASRLEKYRRSILFVAPDLFVLHDHLVAKQPVNFLMLLHPPSATRVDPIWHDLRLQLPKASLRINAPSRRELRKWEPMTSPAAPSLPGTMTVKVGPTNKVTQADLLTVFAIQPNGRKMDYAFKLVESNTAVGARIHREGLPTLVAFRLAATNATASLDGFKFEGAVGVSVFRPPRKPH